jgi:hypothetical protein
LHVLERSFDDVFRVVLPVLKMQRLSLLCTAYLNSCGVVYVDMRVEENLG